MEARLYSMTSIYIRSARYYAASPLSRVCSAVPGYGFVPRVTNQVPVKCSYHTRMSFIYDDGRITTIHPNNPPLYCDSLK